MNKVIVLSLLTFSLTLGLNQANAKPEKLPPGLEKKLKQGKPLPPGWQKKLQVGERLDPDIYDHGKVIYRDRDRDLVTISVEGRVIKVLENTLEIVEILKGMR